MSGNNRSTQHIRPQQIFGAIADFHPSYAATRGEFAIDVPGFAKDLEWNYLDQHHRPFMHHTYQDNLRIALGRDFSVSLTRWGRLPFLITVTDMRIEENLYYQVFVLAGLIFVHNMNTLSATGEMVHLKVEWVICSHRWLKPLHGFLNRKLYKLNARLQPEDAPIRSQRYRLRKLGYAFRSDPPDFYNSNQLTNNTVYPPLPDDAAIALDTLPMNAMTPCSVGNVEFLVRREEGRVLVWPSACPHEGGELAKGKLHNDCRLECPWHGLKFTAAQLTAQQPEVEIYGFYYTLEPEAIRIRPAPKKTSGE